MANLRAGRLRRAIPAREEARPPSPPVPPAPKARRVNHNSHIAMLYLFGGIILIAALSRVLE